MKTKTINLYSFSELSKEAKEYAIDKWYENKDYPFLGDDLTEFCKEYLKENGCTFNPAQIKLLYSLSNSQGDGLCFTGEISKNGFTLKLTHINNYYFASSVNMEFFDSEGNEIDDLTNEDRAKTKELHDIYMNICAKLEKEGYDILEYRMNDTEFNELCESNEYTFLENGKMENI